MYPFINQGTDATLEPAYFANLFGALTGTSDAELKAYVKAIVGDDIPSSALDSSSAFESWLTSKGWTLKDLSAMIISGSATITSPLTATRTVGGVTSGKHYETGTTIEQIIRDILNPVDGPTLTNPSATITYNGEKLLEKGVQIAATLVVNFNRGSISPAYGTSGYRSGPATGYSLNGGTTQSSNTFTGIAINEDRTNFTAKVNYSAGEQPKDSSGNDYNSPLPAGSVTSSALKFEFVNALWQDSAGDGTVTKLPLVSKLGGEYIFDLPPQTADHPETFDIPADWNVTDILVENPFYQTWDDDSDEFDVTTVTHEDAAGRTVTYKRYTDNRGYPAGARQIKVKWTQS